MKKKTKKHCQNCKNKRISLYNLQIAGLTIHLCKQCWIGFSYGMKKDFERFDRDEVEFNEAVQNTRKIEKSGGENK